MEAQGFLCPWYGVLCYYLEGQDGVEDGPHASLNLLSVESIETKVGKDGQKK